MADVSVAQFLVERCSNATRIQVDSRGRECRVGLRAGPLRWRRVEETEIESGSRSNLYRKTKISKLRSNVRLFG